MPQPTTPVESRCASPSALRLAWALAELAIIERGGGFHAGGRLPEHLPIWACVRFEGRQWIGGGRTVQEAKEQLALVLLVQSEEPLP